MNRTLITSLVFIFLATVLAGFLSPREIKEIQEIIFEPVEEVVEEDVVVEESEPVVTERIFYPVVRVIDGDTIVIRINGTDESVRMIGLDTPETVHPSKPVQCFGTEASKKTKEWLEGQRVELIVDPEEGERDKYYRLLGYVYRDDGYFINLELIRQGYAYEYTYDLPYQYQADFVAAEKHAAENKLGLWADGVCE